MVVYDSSVFIDQLRTGRYTQQMDSTPELARTSSVVLAELWRGATTDAERVFLHALERSHPIWSPSESNWIESGRLLDKMQRNHGFAAAKLRDLHFDVLIALTARSHGARVVTSNRTDFELIRRYRDFMMEVW